METKLTPTHLCSTCSNPAIALDDDGRPLCVGHASFFATAPHVRAHDSEPAATLGLKPAPMPSAGGTSLVGAVMESIYRNLQGLEDSVLGIEEVAARLRPSREAQIDLEFIVHNMLHDVAEPSPRDAIEPDQWTGLFTDLSTALAS